jgi:cytochrome P450
VHGDPQLHPDPAAFRPERFLAEQGGRVPDYAYIPFGGGAHRCLGAALATLELEQALAAIAEGVDLSPAGAPAKPVRRGITLAPDGGGKVHARCLLPTATG